MNKLFSILIIAGVAIGSIQAASVKQPIQYNNEATQKLQAKLNDIKIAIDGNGITNDIGFLTSVDQLLSQNADPNVISKKGEKDGLLATLFFLLFLNSYKDNVQFSVTLENTIKHALDRGANLDLDGEKGNLLLMAAISAGSATIVKALIDHGIDLTQKDGEGNTVLELTEKTIQEINDALPQMLNEFKPQFKKRRQRFEQGRDILKAAKQKK